MTTKRELLSDPLKVVDALKRGVAQTVNDLKVVGLGELAVEQALNLKLVKFEHVLEPQGVRTFLSPTVKGLRALAVCGSRTMPVYSAAAPAAERKTVAYTTYRPAPSTYYRAGADDATRIASKGV